jgi:hypothetical protein
MPTSKLKQSILIPRNVHVQQAMASTLHVNIHVAIGLSIYDNLIKDRHEEDNLIKIQMEDHLIHMLDVMDGQHIIQGYSCHHGTNQI